MDLFKRVSQKVVLTMIFLNMGVLVSSNAKTEIDREERSVTDVKPKEEKESVVVEQQSREEVIEKLATHILSLEGGYANHKLDKPTNKGIQWQTYKAYAKRLKLDTSRVAFRNLSDNEAKKFVYLFWRLAKVDSIKDKRIAAFFVEEFWAAPISVKFYQQKLNQDFGLCLAEDGGMGTETTKAINSISSKVLIPKLIEWKEERYERIIKRKPKKVVFTKGWQKRRKLFNELFFHNLKLN